MSLEEISDGFLNRVSRAAFSNPFAPDHLERYREAPESIPLRTI